jgi:hypothetical protein
MSHFHCHPFKYPHQSFTFRSSRVSTAEGGSLNKKGDQDYFISTAVQSSHLHNTPSQVVMPADRNLLITSQLVTDMRGSLIMEIHVIFCRKEVTVFFPYPLQLQHIMQS